MGPMLTIDPDKETITNNEAAKAMLMREYRPGFACPKPDAVQSDEQKPRFDLYRAACESVTSRLVLRAMH